MAISIPMGSVATPPCIWQLIQATNKFSLNSSPNGRVVCLSLNILPVINSLYKMVQLSESVTNSDGYLVIAPPSVSQGTTFTALADDWLRAGLDENQMTGAVALYEVK